MTAIVRDMPPGPDARGRYTIRIGNVDVEPSTGRASGPGGEVLIDPKVMAVLVRLADARGELVSRETLMADVWQGTFVTDAALSRCIYQLRKQLAGIAGVDTLAIETLPKRGYRLAWPVSANEERVDNRRRRPRVALAAAAAFTVLLAAGSFAYFQSHDIPWSASVNANVERVAVAPFVDLSADASEAILATGIAQEIMHELAALSGVTVVGQESAFSARHVESNDLARATALNADFLVTGSINNIGNVRRVLVVLRAVPGGDLLASDSYLLERDAPFVVTRDIAESIAERLDFSVASSHEPVTPATLEAFEAYFAARHAADHEAARRLLERAVDLDPQFAAAWTALAEIEVFPAWNGDIEIEDAWRRARQHLDKSIDLDPALPSTWVTLGRYERALGCNEQAIAHYERALELDPGNYWASANLGLLLRWSGQYERALAIHKRAVEMDPLSEGAQTRLGTSYWFAGKPEDAARHYQMAIDLAPDYAEAYDSWAGMLGAGQGRFDEALRMMLRKMSVEEPVTPRTLVTIGDLAGILRLDDVARYYWTSASRINPDYVTVRSRRATFLMERGREQEATDAALETLRQFPLETRSQLILAIQDIEAGETERFVERLKQSYPGYFTELPKLDKAHLDIALLVALGFQVTGDRESELALLDAVQTEIRMPRAREFMWLAAMHAMLGEAEKSLEYLRLSPTGRVRELASLLPRDPRFASLRDNPEFRALVGSHQSALDRQSEGIDPGTIPVQR